MKKFLVLFSVVILIGVGFMGFSTNAKALSILDPGVSPVGCCSNLEWNESLGWVMVIPCVKAGDAYYSVTLLYNTAIGGFTIYTVGQGDGSCVSSGSGGGGTACSDCSCPAYASAHPGECGATGDLNFRITWNDQNDVDLHVTHDNNEHIYYSHKTDSATGGVLDVDANAACSSNVTSRGVENIVYTNPPAGTYVLKICGYKHCTNQPAATTVRAQVLRGGAVVFDQNISISTWSGSSNCTDNVVSYTIH